MKAWVIKALAIADWLPLFKHRATLIGTDNLKVTVTPRGQAATLEVACAQGRVPHLLIPVGLSPRLAEAWVAIAIQELQATAAPPCTCDTTSRRQE